MARSSAIGFRCAAFVFATLGAAAFASTPAPTTLQDFFGPGTQPGGLTDVIEPPTSCDSCHGNYDIAHEPLRPWAASPMGQSARDPLYLACLEVANNDAAFAGDICIRCHAPKGWLEGRSEPTDGSVLTAADTTGINCNFCHRMVDPFDPNHVSPLEDDAILAALPDAPVDAHAGYYVMDPLDRRRGPFDLGNFHKHDWLHSPFHSTSGMCATCHDVSNPAFSAQPDGTYALNDLDAPHPTGNKYDMFPVERTYSEWSVSAFAAAPVEMGRRFGGNLTAVSTCQDCHQPDATGKGCKTGELRTNLPTHQFNGGNTWMVQAVRNLHSDSETFLEDQSVADSVARTIAMLQAASDMELEQDGPDLLVRIINMTGHKLPSGYPEGRRMWVHVAFYDANGALVAEHGHYDHATAVLTASDTVVYETRLGIDATVAGATGLPEGEGFHFAVNSVIHKDNRIPPMGFTNAAFAAVQAAPVGHTYADGQYWDESRFAVPAGAASAEVELYYQSVSLEYAEFLRDFAPTQGPTLWAQYLATGMSAPVEMDAGLLAVAPPTSCPADLDGNGTLNLDDVNLFAGAFVGGNLLADLDGNGALNLDDVNLFAQSFVAGCP